MWEQISLKFVDAAGGVAVALLGLASAYAVFYLRQAEAKVRAETARMKDQAKAEMIREAVGRLEDITEKVVLKIEQTVAGDLRKAVKDGRVDRSELLSLGKKAYAEVLTMVEPEVVKILQENLGDFRGYLESIIEAQVKRLKESK